MPRDHSWQVVGVGQARPANETKRDTSCCLRLCEEVSLGLFVVGTVGDFKVVPEIVC